MIIFLALLLQFSNPVQAAPEKFLCSALVGKSFYDELKVMKVSDKTKHCSLSCYLALRCGGLESFNVGMVKEILDLLSPGNAEWADVRANKQGITFAVTDRARNKQQCLRECRSVYE